MSPKCVKNDPLWMMCHEGHVVSEEPQYSSRSSELSKPLESSLNVQVMEVIVLTDLPDHVSVIQRPELWMEPDAIEQLVQVASLPRCRRAVGMPDLHQGRGIPVGAAFAFDGELRPPLIGGDMGCGVSLIVVPKPRKRGEAMKRRLHTGDSNLFEACDTPREALTAIWREGPSALARFDFLPESLQALAEARASLPHAGSQRVNASPHLPSCLTRIERYLSQLGTPGGGNHFLEISRVAERVSDVELDDDLGLKQGAYAVLAHSGSRGLGGDLSAQWTGRVLEDPAEQSIYLSELQGAVNYARCNRFILQWMGLNALGCAQESRVAGQLDLVHNEVISSELEGDQVWLHRKGSAPAERGQLTVVLGTRGTRSWVMRGLGEDSCLCSVAHGAGRKMGRGEAVAKFKGRFTKKSLIKTEMGGEVICDNAQLLYEEHPRAYKAIEPVISSLVAAGAAERVAALEPILTYKMSEGHRHDR